MQQLAQRLVQQAKLVRLVKRQAPLDRIVLDDPEETFESVGIVFFICVSGKKVYMIIR
ncbi:hypothetical protein D3C85_1865650 [compost metagenome]